MTEASPPQPQTLAEAQGVITALWAENAQLRARLARLDLLLQVATGQAGQTSANSSRPPSTDPSQALPQPAGAVAGAVDLRDRAGGGADQQRRRPGGAAGGAVAQGQLRQPERGRAVFVARLLSVAATCRQHDRSLLDYLTAVCTAAQHGQLIPSLLPDPTPAQAA